MGNDAMTGTEKASSAGGAAHLIAVAAFGLAASMAIFAIMQRLDRTRAEGHFLQVAEQRLSAVRANVVDPLDTIAVLASHFEAAGDDGTGRQAFSTLVAPVLENHRYLLALGWIPRVEREARQKYERLAQGDGIQDFRFKELAADGNLAVEGERDRYFPVFYVEPPAARERVLGYDLASVPQRSAVMARARDTRRLLATARVKLLQNKGDQWGILVLAPSYDRRANLDSIPARERALRGFALGTLRIGDLIAGGDNAPQKLDTALATEIHLFDMSAADPERQLYPQSPVTTPEQLTRGLHAKESFEVGGRTWLLVATPAAGFANRSSSPDAWLVLVLGLLFTGVYLRYLKSKVVQSAQIARAAQEIEHAQAELKQTSGTLEAVIRCSPLAVVVLDLEGRATLWNPAAERMHGWTKEEVLGGYLPVILPKHDPDEVRRVHQRILSEGGVTGLEYLCVTKQGNLITVSVSGAPLHNAAGEQNGAVYLVMDITEQKRLESQLGQAQKLESIGQLAAGIAHEINTPIQYVGDNLRFLQESFESRNKLYEAYDRLVKGIQTGLPVGDLAAECEATLREVDGDYLRQEVPRALQQSLEGVDHVARIVGAMKEFSHFGTVGKTPVDINHAIESTILVSRNEWKYVAEMKTEFDPELPGVPCVPSELNQVILNLIINSAHAIADVVERQPGARGAITVSTRRDRDWAEIRVRDTGAGIPEEARPHIFNPFFTTKGVGKGTGQGLAIAHAVVVQRHGGSIGFETQVGVGTTFVVRLPLGRANETHPVCG